MKKLVNVLGHFPIKSIFISLIIVVVLSIGVSKIYMATGNDTLVKRETDVYQDNDMLEEEFGGESVIVLYESENLLTPKHLAHMKGIEDVLQRNDSIYSILSPVTLTEEIAKKQSEAFQNGTSEVVDGLEDMGNQLIETGKGLKANVTDNSDMDQRQGNSSTPDEMEKEMEENRREKSTELKTIVDALSMTGEKLQSISDNMSTMEDSSDIMTPGLPEKQNTLNHMIYDDDGQLRTMFEEVVVDDHHMVMMIKFNGHTEDEEKSEVVDIIHTYLDDEPMDSTEIIVSGKPVLDHGIRSSMQDSIQKMMGLALLLMVIVLFFVFKVRWFLLPLLIVITAVIGTVGLMGWLQIPITMVSMAVFPILIGLGIDYAIQFQNRYTEELVEEDSNE